MPPFEAALKGSREIGFTIVSITISLVAVFIPVLLMGGVVGRIFNEFAMVVTIAIVASAFVSLTLTPMLCARLPGAQRAAATRRRRIRRAHLRRRCTRAIALPLDFCLAARPLVLLVFLAHRRGTVWLFVDLAQGLLPAGGYRPALGLDRGAPGHLVRRHAGAAEAGRVGAFQAIRPMSPTSPRSSAAASARPTAQPGRLVRRAEAQGRAARRSPTILADLRRDARPDPRHLEPSSCRCRTSASAARSSKSQYQFVGAGARPRRARRPGRTSSPTRWAATTAFTDVTTDSRTTPCRRRSWSTATRPRARHHRRPAPQRRSTRLRHRRPRPSTRPATTTR